MNDIKLVCVKEEEFPIIREFYDDVIRRTKDMDNHAKWKIGMHPTDETLLGYIREGSLYKCMDHDKLVGALAIPLYQGEDYKMISWGVEAADDEVSTLHIFAVSPDEQGKGYGRLMIRDAINIVREAGMKALRLDTLITNKPSHKMYENWGFHYRGKQNLFAQTVGYIDFLYYELSL